MGTFRGVGAQLSTTPPPPQKKKMTVCCGKGIDMWFCDTCTIIYYKMKYNE